MSHVIKHHIVGDLSPISPGLVDRGLLITHNLDSLFFLSFPSPASSPARGLFSFVWCRVVFHLGIPHFRDGHLESNSRDAWQLLAWRYVDHLIQFFCLLLLCFGLLFRSPFCMSTTIKVAIALPFLGRWSVVWYGICGIGSCCNCHSWYFLCYVSCPQCTKKNNSYGSICIMRSTMVDAITFCIFPLYMVLRIDVCYLVVNCL